MKKLIVVLLALAMVLSLAACGTTKPEETTAPETTPESTPAETTPAETTPAETTPAETTPAPEASQPAESQPAESTPAETDNGDGPVGPGQLAGSYMDPEVYKTFDAGSITTTLAGGATGGSINKIAFAGDAAKDYRDAGFYTYNDFLGSTTGLNWNPLSWETNDDSYFLAYLTMGFYDFVLNEDLTGYAIIPEMAADYPVDVTADYVGKYGIVEGDTAKVWKITLNQNATWDDGSKITADDYIYSMQQQLHPKMLNRRADSYYAGDLVIVNAKNYLYDGKVISEQVYNGSEAVFAVADLVKDGNGNYTTADGSAVKIALKSGLNWLSGNSLEAYVNAYGAAYFDVESFNALLALADADGYVVLNDTTLDLIVKVITAVEAWGETADNAVDYMVYDKAMPKVTWDEVGLEKIDDYTIVLALEKAIEEPEFYVPYNLSSNWLVKESAFEASKKFYDKDGKELAADGENCVSITSTYCTSLETSVSYGPYVLSNFEADKAFTFVRNENWYGYKDEKHYGQFQTDKIAVQIIGDHNTALQAFLAGDIDGVGLQSEDMAKYVSSDRIVYTPESYTTKITFNTDYEKLVALGNNAQVLAVKEFRQGFALALDRVHFATAYTSAGSAGFGLLNYMYCYNPFSGELYRDSDAAKAALCAVYGVEYGEDEDYATLDAAYKAITGYVMEEAQEYMQIAYDKAVAAGIYDGEGAVKLDMRVYQADEIYIKMFTYFEEQLKKACEGTGFEGKVSMQMTVDADYYETMYSGNTAIIFSTWGGAAMSPFTMINQCYTDAYDGSGNQMEIGYNTTLVNVTYTIDGHEITASLKDWADWCGGNDIDAITSVLGDFAKYSYATRCEIFAKVEEIYLSSFVTTPIYYRNGASLVSKKLENATDDYLQIVGRGGIRYITYNYNDEQWAGVKADIKY